MNRKSFQGAAAIPPPEWDPSAAEPWFLQLKTEPLNDKKWSCIVTAAVPNEAQDEDCVQTYAEYVNTGSRKAVKIISMNGVVKLLKTSNASSNSIANKKEDKHGKPTGRTHNLKPPVPPFPQVVNLAAQYVTFTDFECKLPPDLMAAVLKFMILNLKNESMFMKKTNAMRERMIREQNIKARFIRDLKPYSVKQSEYGETSEEDLEIQHPNNDEPIEGPDLYIVLTDFYDPFIFLHLQAISVPFLAILKISVQRGNVHNKPFRVTEAEEEAGRRKNSMVTAFWECLKQRYNNSMFKDILMMDYQAPSRSEDPSPEDANDPCRTIFDELTWTQYSAYCIHRQHQKYLKELVVQRLIQSLEPLDLSKCEVYNKLCDALVTGEPLTPFLVLYAMVEQVVAGVPETNTAVLEYEPLPTDFFWTPSDATRRVHIVTKAVELVTPCKKCRFKKYENICDKLKEMSAENELLKEEEDEWVQDSENSTTSSGLIPSQPEEKSPKLTETSGETTSSDTQITESLISKVMSERKTEKELRDDKTWKTPSLCFYGDSVFLQSYFCDPRLFDSGSVVERFLKNSALPQVWRRYPQLPPEERAFCNFHFYTLRKISEQTQEMLKLKILFVSLMKLIGKTGPYLGKDEEVKMDRENPQDKCGTAVPEGEKNFVNYFFKTFIVGRYFRMGSEIQEKPERVQETVDSISNTDMSMTNRSSIFKCTEEMSGRDRVLTTFYSLLDCFQISSVNERSCLRDNEDYLSLVQDFKYYEKFEPELMIQRLIEGQQAFNTILYSYFAPTDTLLVVMHNDFDYRGLYRRREIGALPTPVSLRDFYAKVYPEIGDWLIQEYTEHSKFISELAEQKKAKENAKDEAYLTLLKNEYRGLSETKRKEFLETEVETDLEPKVRGKKLGQLPVRPKPLAPEKISFVTTNFSDVRVENERNVVEFHSQDGTMVSVSRDSWLYAPSGLLKVGVKRSGYYLLYYQWLNQDEVNTSFTFKTVSDIIFAFSKDPDEESDFNYNLTMTWPTGLMIQPLLRGEDGYVRQAYLKPYRRGWEIEEEVSRCFLKTGKLLVMKDGGDFEILCGSGTRIAFLDSSTTSRYEIVSTTGEVWHIRTKGRCKNKRILMGSNKVFIGVDPKTNETFYKREDGVQCMLSPDATLVTVFPDGTKITTTPNFKGEFLVEWSDWEIMLFTELKSKCKLVKYDQEQKSRTILRNYSTPRTTSSKSIFEESFVLVTCSYLIEHPKYARIYFDHGNPYVKATMPDNLSILMYPEGNYELQQDRNFLTVFGNKIEFYMNCYDCRGRSTVRLNLNSNEVLCQCVDFFEKAFFVYRDGGTRFEECYREYDEESFVNNKEYDKICPSRHARNPCLKQRCFALERDLSGVEFLHADALAMSLYHLPEDTFFELDSSDPANIIHTFNSPFYKIGYQKWVMEYENDSNSLPRNLKKSDLKELGVKQVQINFFKYPFPKHHNCSNRPRSEGVGKNVQEPKVIVTRTVRCLSQNPNSMMEELENWVAAYQQKARKIFNAYANHKTEDDRSQDARYMDMRLRKIAMTLSQSLKMYPHLCTSLPSTEKEIHYFGHFINSGELMKTHRRDCSGILPDCKQIPSRFPRPGDFSCIYEENETSQT